MQVLDPRLNPNIIRRGRRFGSVRGRVREGRLESRGEERKVEE